jgi:hypothetical protein
VADWNSRERDFEAHPFRVGLKWLLTAVVMIAIVVAVIAGISWVFGWGNEAGRITGPGNVREQNTAIIDDYEAMDAAAANACEAKTASNGSDDPTLVEDPALAYKATYRRIRVDYNRRMANLYEAQAVRNLPLPSNLRSYPRRAPALEQKMKEAC